MAGGLEQLGQEQAHAAGAGLHGDGVERGGRRAGRPEVAGGPGAHAVEEPPPEIDRHLGGPLLGLGGGGRRARRAVGGQQMLRGHPGPRAPAARSRPAPLPPEG